jgi:DNA-binding XRE family transcriptional regulator
MIFMQYTDYDYNEIRKVGSRVRALMNPVTDTVASLASIISVTPSHMSKLLDDKCEWTIEKVISIAEYFDVPVEFIYFGDDIFAKVDKENFVAQFKGTLMHIDRLPVEERKVCYREMANKLLEMILRCIG